MDVKVYKIYNPVTGKFSKGGMAKPNYANPTQFNWGKKGKTWTSLGFIKSHLNLQYIRKFNMDKNYEYVERYSLLLQQYLKDNCEVWEYGVDGINKFSVKELVQYDVGHIF